MSAQAVLGGSDATTSAQDICADRLAIGEISLLRCLAAFWKFDFSNFGVVKLICASPVPLVGVVVEPSWLFPSFVLSSLPAGLPLWLLRQTDDAFDVSVVEQVDAPASLVEHDLVTPMSA
mmetsp:Transcript_7592/g.13960  ORF Transcript_7592/g.13960 Transcript_7592/m.13960 type:complete len:120 (-) Transcript_7592:74-433(-)